MARTIVSDVAFTPAVKAMQDRRGSRRHYAQMEEKRGWQNAVTPDLAAFISERDSFYFATANREGQPYIQHRGGPPGFLRVLDERTLAFADFGGNRQYITIGNLTDNPRAFIFLMDYGNRRRVKIWGKARVVEDDPAFIESLSVPGYPGKPEQAIVFTIDAWNPNCRQHIPQKFAAEEVAEVVGRLEARIAELEGELRRLRESGPTPAK